MTQLILAKLQGMQGKKLSTDYTDYTDGEENDIATKRCRGTKRKHWSSSRLRSCSSKVSDRDPIHPLLCFFVAAICFFSHLCNLCNLWITTLWIVLLSFRANAFTKNTARARHARLSPGRRAQARVRHRCHQAGLRALRVRAARNSRRRKHRNVDGQVR